MGCPIVWSAFSWEAFATLATGLAAVIAASIIGWRQTGIQTRQTEILEQQALAQSLALKVELFDRRYSVYDMVKEHLGSMLNDGRIPNDETTRNFHIAMGEAKLLFSDEVSSGLSEIWKLSCELDEAVSQMTQSYSNSGDNGVENSRRKSELGRKLNSRLQTLPELFAEMSLKQI
jgi:hypothetical protein